MDLSEDRVSTPSLPFNTLSGLEAVASVVLTTFASPGQSTRDAEALDEHLTNVGDVRPRSCQRSRWVTQRPWLCRCSMRVWAPSLSSVFLLFYLILATQRLEAGLSRKRSWCFSRVVLSVNKAQSEAVSHEADKLKKFLNSMSFLSACLQSLPFIAPLLIDLYWAARELMRWPLGFSKGSAREGSPLVTIFRAYLKVVKAKRERDES